MKDLTQNERIANLEKRLTLLEQRLAVLGVPIERWITPNQAAKLIGVSRTIIMREIRKAEYARIFKIRYDLKYGKHYRKVGENWQVCDRDFKAIILDTHPGERIAIEVPDWFEFQTTR